MEAVVELLVVELLAILARLLFDRIVAWLLHLPGSAPAPLRLAG